MLAGGGSLFGLALGVLLALAFELRKDTILGEWELPAGVRVLGILPPINISAKKSSNERFWKRNGKRVLGVQSTAVLLAIMTIAPSGVWFSGRT
jgi:hypothetical protein